MYEQGLGSATRMFAKGGVPLPIGYVPPDCRQVATVFAEASALHGVEVHGQLTAGLRKTDELHYVGFRGDGFPDTGKGL